MPNLLMLGKQYEAYVTVIEGQAGGPLIYRDSHGHIHIVPTSPDSRRIAEELEPELKALQGSNRRRCREAERAEP